MQQGYLGRIRLHCLYCLSVVTLNYNDNIFPNPSYSPVGRVGLEDRAVEVPAQPRERGGGGAHVVKLWSLRW